MRLRKVLNYNESINSVYSKKNKVTIWPEISSKSTTKAVSAISLKNSKNQVDTFIDVGPYKCKPSRSKRTKETNYLWSKIDVREFVNDCLGRSCCLLEKPCNVIKMEPF